MTQQQTAKERNSVCYNVQSLKSESRVIPPHKRISEGSLTVSEVVFITQKKSLEVTLQANAKLAAAFLLLISIIKSESSFQSIIPKFFNNISDMNVEVRSRIRPVTSRQLSQGMTHLFMTV